LGDCWEHWPRGARLRLPRVGVSIEQHCMAFYEAVGDKLSYVRVGLNRAVSAAQVG
jgi:hypothetical protein